MEPLCDIIMRGATWTVIFLFDFETKWQDCQFYCPFCLVCQRTAWFLAFFSYVNAQTVSLRSLQPSLPASTEPYVTKRGVLISADSSTPDVKSGLATQTGLSRLGPATPQTSVIVSLPTERRFGGLVTKGILWTAGTATSCEVSIAAANFLALLQEG